LPDSTKSIHASIAAYTSWGRTADRAARTQPARDAADARFRVKVVDPDGVLTADEQSRLMAAMDPAELERRAESYRLAYFQRLALKSAQARRLKRAS
jgi:hypothetical protein